MQKVIRKNVVVVIELDGANSEYDKTIDLSFTPDVMNVKYSHFYDVNYSSKLPISAWTPVQVDMTSVAQNWPIPTYSNQSNTINLCKFNLVSDYIFPFSDTADIQQVNTTWDIHGPVSGNYVFSVHDADGSLVSTEDGTLTIHLEFLKYVN